MSKTVVWVGVAVVLFWLYKNKAQAATTDQAGVALSTFGASMGTAAIPSVN